MTANLPIGSCDCHFHIMDVNALTIANPLVPNRSAPVRSYRAFATGLNLTHGVVVQPSLYGMNNDLTLQALRTLGPNYRAIVVINDSASLEQLVNWNAAGVRGVRFNQVQTGATTLGMLPTVARLIRDLGWHIQLHIHADQLQALENSLEALPVPIVLDHFGRIPLPGGTSHAAWQVMRRLLDRGRLWVKLSGPYLISRNSSLDYVDAVQLAHELLRVAPDRVLWGSDWPHVTEEVAPTPAGLTKFAIDSVGHHFQKVLFDNPAKLYGF